MSNLKHRSLKTAHVQVCPKADAGTCQRAKYAENDRAQLRSTMWNCHLNLIPVPQTMFKIGGPHNGRRPFGFTGKANLTKGYPQRRHRPSSFPFQGARISRYFPSAPRIRAQETFSGQAKDARLSLAINFGLLTLCFFVGGALNIYIYIYLLEDHVLIDHCESAL